MSKHDKDLPLKNGGKVEIIINTPKKVSVSGKSVAVQFGIDGNRIPGNGIEFIFSKPKTVDVSGEAVEMVFGDVDTPSPEATAIIASGFLSELSSGAELIAYRVRNIGITGIIGSSYGNAKIINTAMGVRASGLVATAFGLVKIDLHTKNISLNGFNTSLYGRATIYNLRQYILASGRSMGVYGAAYVQGGVKEVRASGFNSSSLPQPKLTNTRADQTISPTGIASPNINRPNVSPRILYPKGISSLDFGSAWVQRNPSPKGFTADSYGTAWISHSPRYLIPSKVDAFQSGYPKIFDPTQHIYHAGSPHIPGGIFGDIAIRNVRRLIGVIGLDQAVYGDWSNVFSNLTHIRVQSFDANVFGNNTISNKTPSIIPFAWDGATFGNTFISDRIRRINARGIGWSESQRFGKHIFSKPPEINLRGFDPMVFGQAFVSNKIREVFIGVGDNLKFSEPSIWHRLRKIELEDCGISSQNFSIPTLTHGVRNLLVKGFDFSVLGNVTTWYRVRALSALGIFKEFETNHQVGCVQYVQVNGFVATQFGLRIIPEIQSVYAKPFDAQLFTEKNQIELLKRWVRATGFLTFGVQTSDRYGTAYIWNKRQYIEHNYDSGDGLNQGEFGKWSAIINRNRKINVYGFDASRHSYNLIDNKARSLLPLGKDHLEFGMGMVADRVRRIKFIGIDEPYFSTWIRTYNTAFVISSVGKNYEQWGKPTVLNTRREYRWIGAFESMRFGNPMIAFRIRKLSVESRYSIAQIYMPLPKVDLYTRYVDPPNIDLSAFGGPSLYIKWNTFTPRWTHRELFGDPSVRNLTPELRQRGNNTEEFGKADVYLYKQYVSIDGYVSELFGKKIISYRDRSMSINGRNYMAFGLHKVIKTGAPPYSLQQITLDWDGEGPRPDGYSGKGVSPPERQVSTPSLKTNVIFNEGFVATKFGSTNTQSNGILIEPGIQEFVIGNHFVGLKNRTIEVPTMGDFLQIKDTRPRVSPHTIYAVTEAPQQAKLNHPSKNLHFVNSDGEVFGNTMVTRKHRTITRLGSYQSSYGIPSIQLVKNYLNPQSIRSFRMGWHIISNGEARDLAQFSKTDQSQYGNHLVSFADDKHKYIFMAGLSSNLMGATTINHFHRIINLKGFDASLLGSSRGGDTPYKPQSLWVGENMPTIQEGFDGQIFGKTWISLKVRDMSVLGFDSMAMDWDISNYKNRLKLTLIKKPIFIDVKNVQHISFNHALYGIPNIKLKTHYIRPDGNSDQYRKGSPK